MATNLKLSNVLENKHELTELPIPEEEKEHDECIQSVRCDGVVKTFPS